MNPIYQFLKENNLTTKDQKTFEKDYSDSTKAKELHSFFQENKLTDKDFNSFYDTYLKKKEGSAVSLTGGTPGTLEAPLVEKPPKGFEGLKPAKVQPTQVFEEKGVGEATMLTRKMERAQKQAISGTGVRLPAAPKAVAAERGMQRAIEPMVEKDLRKQEQSWLSNTVSALDRGFYKNLVGNPIKGLGTLLQYGTAKLTGGTGREVISDALIQFGDYFNRAIDEVAPQDESFKGSLSDQFAQALGQVGSIVITGGIGTAGKGTALAEQAIPKAVLTGGVGKAAPAIAATKGAAKKLVSELATPATISAGLTTGQAEFDRAKKAGATDEQAFEAFYKNAAVGSILEKIPVMQFFKRFNNATQGGIVNYLKTKGVGGLTGGLEEATTEVLQQVYSNKTAKDIYNANQDIFEGLTESGGIGFGVGFLLNAMGANAKILRKQGKEAEAQLVDAQINEFKSRAEKGPEAPPAAPPTPSAEVVSEEKVVTTPTEEIKAEEVVQPVGEVEAVTSESESVELKNEGKADTPTKETVQERLNINNPFYKKVEDALVKLGLIEKYNPKTGTGDVIGGVAQPLSDKGGFAVGDMYFYPDGSISYVSSKGTVQFDKNGNVISENTKEVSAKNRQNEIKGKKESIANLEKTKNSEDFKYKEVTETDVLGNKKKVKRLKTEQELKESTDKINAAINKAKKELAELTSEKIETIPQVPATEEKTYRVEYFDPETRKMTHQMFATEAEGEAFKKTLTREQTSQGVTSYFEKAPAKGVGEVVTEAAPQVPAASEIEAKKADIERRRQEELKAIPLAETRDEINNGAIMETIPGDKFGNTRNRFIPFSIIEEANKNDKYSGQTARQISQRGGYSDKRLDELLPNWRSMLPEATEINAKYNAELEALGVGEVAPEAAPQVPVTPESQKADIEKTKYGTISGSIPLSEALPNGVYVDLGNGLFAYADKSDKIAAIVDRNNNYIVSKSFWNPKESKWQLPNKANLADDAKKLGVNQNEYIQKYQDAVNALNEKGVGEVVTEATPEVPATPEVTDTEYNEFIDKGIVAPERLNEIAQKVKNRETLSEREQAIFTDKTAEINKIIAGEVEAAPQVPAAERQNWTEQQYKDEIKRLRQLEGTEPLVEELINELGKKTIADIEAAKGRAGEKVEKKTEVSNLQGAINRYEEGEIETFDDLVNEVEAIADIENDQLLKDAVADYREEQRYNESLKGRGDMDAAEGAFLDKIKSAGEVMTEATPQVPAAPIAEEEIKTEEYAIPEPGPAGLLQRTQKRAGEEGGERGGVESPVERLAATKKGKAESAQKEIARRKKKYAPPTGRQSEVNKFLEEVYKFNQLKKGLQGLKKVENLRKRSDLLLEAQRLGIQYKVRTDGSIKIKGVRAIDNSNSNMAIDDKFVPLEQRGEKVKKLFDRINGLAKAFGADFEFYMPNVIIGADGKKMAKRQIRNAVNDLNNGIPSKGANALLNSLEAMAESGIVEVRVGQEVEGVPIDQYFDELEKQGERDLGIVLSEDADVLPEADLVKWVEEMADEQSFETEIYEPDTEEITAEGGEEPTPKREGEKPVAGATRGPVPPSRGGAPAAEGGEGGKRVSGIKKALVSERILAEVDLEKVGDKELLEKGREIIASGEVEPKLLIDKIIEDKEGVLTPAEVVALITYKAELDTKIEDLSAEIAKKEAAKEDLGTLQVELKNLETERDNFEIAAVITAQQQSLSFRLRRYMLDRDFNINVAIAKYKRANGGVIPADVEQAFREIDEQTKELNKKLKEEEAKVYEEEGKKAADNIVEDVKRETEEKDAKKSYSKKAKDVADKFRKLKKKPFKFTDENGNEIDVQKMGVSVWDAAIEAGAKAIEISGQIADGIAVVIEKIKDTDFYKNLSKKDRDRFEASLEDYYTKEIESTPEAKKLKALQKKLDDILAGNVRQGNTVSFAEESPEVRALREQIFEAKKNLGLIRSKMKKPGDVKEYKPSIDENGQLSIPPQYIRDLVGVQGITTIEGMTDAAFKELEPLVPGLTKRQVRDAITKYGQKVNPTLDQVRTDINRAKRIGALISELEDLQSMTPAEFAVKYRKLKPSRANLSNAEKELKRQINSLKRDLDLDGRINDAIKRAEESLAEYQRKIDELDFAAKQQGLPETPELRAAREARDAKRKEYEALKKADPAAKLATAKKAARKAIAELQERIQTKNFSKAPKKKGPIDAELYILNAQKEALKEKAAAIQKKIEREKRGWKGVLSEALKELSNIPRTLVAGFFDLGAVFSQGVRMVYTSPVMSAKAFAQSVIQGFSSKKHDQWLASLRSRPEYNLIKKSGLAISDPGHVLSEEEGIIIAKYANFIWNTLAKAITFGHRPSAKFIQELSPIKFSQRAFDGYMNYIRVSTFLKDSKALIQDGYTLDSNPEIFKEMAIHVNTLTGRADMGKLEGSANWLSTVLFAPKKLVSELKLYTPYAFLYYANMPKPVRKRALIELGTFAMSFLATSALLKAALDATRGKDEEEDEQFWDIDSPNFLTFKIGNQRVSFAGAIKTTLVFMGRLFGDRYVDQYGRESKFGERVGKKVNTKFDLTTRFFAGKASPSVGLLRDLADRNPNIDNDDEIYENVVMPMWLQDANELKKDNPAEMQSLFMLLGFIGANVRTVDIDRMQKNISFKEEVKGKEITRNVKLTDEQLQEFQELYETELSRQTSKITSQINLAAGPKERREITDVAREKAKKLAQEKLEKIYVNEFRDFPQREKEEPSELVEKAKRKLQ